MLKNEEEFNNFMHRVTDVHEIVKKLSSKNGDTNKIGLKEADRYLDDSTEKICEKIDDMNIELRIKQNKSLINKIKEDKKNDKEMSQEAFMREVERDAKKRHEDKKIRKEHSDTLKTQGNKAFRRGEYEKALCLYNKAIDLIRDSCVLYTNRALAYTKLRIYDKAIHDCKTALKLNENSLKAWMYMAQVYYKLGDSKQSEICVNEAKNRHPESKYSIEKFVTEYQLTVDNV